MFDILEIDPAAGPSIDGILSRVHPEDGAMVRKLTEDLAEKKETWSMPFPCGRAAARPCGKRPW